MIVFGAGTVTEICKLNDQIIPRFRNDRKPSQSTHPTSHVSSSSFYTLPKEFFSLIISIGYYYLLYITIGYLSTALSLRFSSCHIIYEDLDYEIYARKTERFFSFSKNAFSSLLYSSSVHACRHIGSKDFVTAKHSFILSQGYSKHSPQVFIPRSSQHLTT